MKRLYGSCVVLFVRLLLLNLLLLLTHQFLYAQVNIRGFVFNTTTVSAIENATIELDGKKTYRTISDSSGAFILRPGSIGVFDLKVSHISYKEIEQKLVIQGDTVLYLYLQPANDSLDEVLVTARNKTLSANVLFSRDEILQKGSVLGEANVYEALQRQAGIIHTHEFNSGLYVRGLGSGNTGVFINGINTFSGNHLLGIYPVINADAFTNVKLLKEDIHPKYTGYLSSYLLLETENKISDSIKGYAELGILTTKLGVNIPVLKNKVGFISHFRRSYFDVISNSYNSIYNNKVNYSPLPSYGFYDWNNTLLIKPNKRALLRLNTFYSSDKLHMKNSEALNIDADWKNLAIGANWQYTFNRNKKLTINVGHAGYTANMAYSELMKQMNNKISESSVQANLYWLVSDKLSFDYGLYTKYSTLSMNSESQFAIETSNDQITMHKKNAQNYGGYIFSTILPEKSMTLKLGSQLDYYQSDQSFLTFSPTVNLLYKGGKQSILLNISRRVQFSHMYVPLGVQLPMNIWYPSTSQAPPENAWNFSATYTKMFNKKLKWSLSAYYMLLKNQIEFLDKNYFSSLDFNTSIGQGTSKGIEFNLYYNNKRFQMESHYTLGKSTCQFPGINNGIAYSLPYDIRHKLDLSFSWRWHRNWLFSFSQFVQSGFLMTIPTGLYIHQDADGNQFEVHEVPIYNDRNNFRMPLSHRMDISIRHQLMIKKLRCSWTTGIYNTYAYQNPYFIYFLVVKNEQNQTYLQARKKSILPLVPFFSIRTEF
ncbi:TonB-dependent receptor [Chitinophagaceae bacterium LB-8]|uniref:TonB-dependent receptor n=1 Tax=Paraflavisolibacter caeni TaxID=2982496 RepID=A0A9X3B7T9_9BACT|nr:carboxypeptidase-like regulatory domain-containing protein [Paraflavisolibacter caeni]MCU7549710.1 TonB-dependent receptor [Paraflavisolibacter caeni]